MKHEVLSKGWAALTWLRIKVMPGKDESTLYRTCIQVHGSERPCWPSGARILLLRRVRLQVSQKLWKDFDTRTFWHKWRLLGTPGKPPSLAKENFAALA